MQRRRVTVFVYLALGLAFLAAAIPAAQRNTMLTLGIVFLILALVQWRQRPRPGGRR